MNAATQSYLVTARTNGDTAAEAAAALAADITTDTNILTDSLSGYLTTTPNLFNAYLAFKLGQLPEQLGAFAGAFATLEYILTHLRGTVVNGQTQGGFIRTTDAAIAAQMAEMIAGFQMAGLLSVDEGAGFLALGGGYAYERLTAEEITAHWAAVDAAETLATLRTLSANAYNAVVAAIDEGETDKATLATLFLAELG